MADKVKDCLVNKVECLYIHRAKLRVNTGLEFVRWPETRLWMFANAAAAYFCGWVAKKKQKVVAGLREQSIWNAK